MKALSLAALVFFTAGTSIAQTPAAKINKKNQAQAQVSANGAGRSPVESHGQAIAAPDQDRKPQVKPKATEVKAVATSKPQGKPAKVENVTPPRDAGRVRTAGRPQGAGRPATTTRGGAGRPAKAVGPGKAGGAAKAIGRGRARTIIKHGN